MPVIIFVFFLTFPCVTIIFFSPGIYFFLSRHYYYAFLKLFLSITQIILRLRISLFVCYTGAQLGGHGVPVTPPPPVVGLLLSKQPTIFRWRKRHDNILAVKGIVEKPTFLKFVFL